MGFIGLGPSAGAAGDTSTSSTSASTSSTISASQSQIDSAEAQVTALEAQISQQQAVLDQTDEQYNQAQVDLSSTKAQLQTTTTSIDAAKARLATERAHLAADAVQDYMGDTSSSAVAVVFASPTSTAQTQAVYQQLGATLVARDVALVQAGQRKLLAVQTKLQGEQQTETDQLTAVDQARQSAETLSNQSEATLAQVKGTLATQIAQQAAAQAAAAAQTAATATTPGAAQARGDAGLTGSPGGPDARRRQLGCPQRHQRRQPGRHDGGHHRRRRRSHRVGQRRLRRGRAGRGARRHQLHGRPLPLGRGQLRRRGLLGTGHAGLGPGRSHDGPLGRRPVRRLPPRSLNQLRPGDLIFFDLDGSGIDHVVMYVGPYLDGQPTPYGNDTHHPGRPHRHRGDVRPHLVLGDGGGGPTVATDRYSLPLAYLLVRPTTVSWRTLGSAGHGDRVGRRRRRALDRIGGPLRRNASRSCPQVVALGVAMPLAIYATVTLCLVSGYSMAFYNKQVFLHQYRHGIYRYRVLGTELLLLIGRITQHFNIHIETRAVVQTQGSEHWNLFTAFFILNGLAFLAFACSSISSRFAINGGSLPTWYSWW